MSISYVMLRSLELAIEQFLGYMEMNGALSFPQPSPLQAEKDQKALPLTALLGPSLSHRHLLTHTYFTRSFLIEEMSGEQ